MELGRPEPLTPDEALPRVQIESAPRLCIQGVHGRSQPNRRRVVVEQMYTSSRWGESIARAHRQEQLSRHCTSVEAMDCSHYLAILASCQQLDSVGLIAELNEAVCMWR